ncbi:conserved hypothetical protein [Brucella pinnipedialis M163/99/10]|nr:conserved hypothetical protein [Brucella pinnipedialis M163/99/10]
MLRLVQFRDERGEAHVAACDDEGAAHVVGGVATTYELASAAISAGISLEEQVACSGKGEAVDIDAALASGRVGLPVSHADSAHLIVTGTGLTHLGSADGRDKMHKAMQSAEKPTGFHAHVPDGCRRWQAEARRDGCAAGMVLQGRWLGACRNRR